METEEGTLVLQPQEMNPAKTWNEIKSGHFPCWDRSPDWLVKGSAESLTKLCQLPTVVCEAVSVCLFAADKVEAICDIAVGNECK